MKIEKYDQTDNAFKPVKLVFTFETQDELDRWASLFNCSEFAKFVYTGLLVEELEDAGGDPQKYYKQFNEMLTNGV